MSTNCIRCVVNKRTGPDLLCDDCRHIEQHSVEDQGPVVEKKEPSSATAHVLQNALELVPQARRDILSSVLDHGPNAAILVTLRLEKLVTEVLSSHSNAAGADQVNQKDEDIAREAAEACLSLDEPDDEWLMTSTKVILAAIRKSTPSALPSVLQMERDTQGLEEKEAEEHSVSAVLQNVLESLRPFHRLALVFDTEPYRKSYPDEFLLRDNSVTTTHNFLTLGHCRRAMETFKAIEKLLSSQGVSLPVTRVEAQLERKEADVSAGDAPKQKWSPIESAPKDGTAIDLLYNGQRWTDCFWGKPDHSCGEAGEYCDSDWHHIRHPGWVYSLFDEFLQGEPTHWMPLPDNPSVEGASKSDTASSASSENPTASPVSSVEQKGEDFGDKGSAQ